VKASYSRVNSFGGVKAKRGFPWAVSWRKVRLRFARGVEVTFADRWRALRQIEEFASEGTWKPVVVYGPEGCGKTALFKQAFEILGGYGYSVVYVSPLEEEEEWRVRASPEVVEVARDLFTLALGERGSALVDLALRILSAVSKRRRLVAILMDDVFQAVGLDAVEVYVKKLLNFLEYPPGGLEKAVVIVGSSEGVSRARVGRHSWADVYMMWNMSKEGFREFYNQIPNGKLSLDEAWAATGGNPRALRDLYLSGWSVEKAVERIASSRGLRRLVASLTEEQRKILAESVEDPDVLYRRLREAQTMEEKRMVEELIDKLVGLNLIVEEISIRSEHIWIDEPPATDRSIGIGNEAAWQSPLHREAVKTALKHLG